MGTALEIVVGTLAGFGAISLALVAYIVAEALYYQVFLAPTLERDLGFRHGTACVPDPLGTRVYISAPAIRSVVYGGVFDRAGIRAGDVLPDLSNTGLFKRLHRHRGRTTELAVVDGGPGPAFSWRPRRLVQVTIPPRKG
jgi:hypothetical protein